MNVRPLALALLLAAPLPAQQGFEHVVPVDSLFYMGIADVETFGRGFRDSSGGRFWYDPANAPLREALGARVDALTSQMHAELGVDPLDFLDMLHGRIALTTIGRPTPEDLDGDGPRGFAVALLADVGPDREECEKLVSALADRLAEDLGAVRKSTLAGDTEVSVLEIDDDPSDDVSVRMKHAFHGGTLVVTVEAHPLQADAMETLLARLDGEGGDTLADAPLFRNSLAAPSGGLQLWIDFGGIFDLVRQGVEASGEEEELDILRRLGLFDIGCLALNSRYEEGGSRLDMRLDWTGNGWIPTFARLMCVSGPAETLAAVPADCRSSITARLDFGGLFDATIKALIDAEQVTMPEVVEFLTEAEEMLGFNPRDDLLDALDGEVTFVTCEVDPEDTLPGMHEDPQNFVLIIGLTDGVRVNTLIEDAVHRTGLHAARKRAEFQGYEMFSVPMPLPGFQINYAVLPDMAVFSMSGTLLQDVLRRKASPDLPALSANKDFKLRLGSLSRLPGLLQYTDTAANMKGALRALSNMTDMLAEMGEELTDELPQLAGLLSLLSDLPPTDEALIDKHFQGASVSAMSVDAQGVLEQAVSP